MDVALIGLQAESRPIEDATRKLDVFTGASKRADAANDERTASSRQVATADQAATVASRANAVALQAQAAAARSAAYSQRVLFPQLLQIGQATPLLFQAPLAFMQQFAFQSADIAQIYAGRGGVTAAIRDSTTMIGRFAARLGPVAVIAGLVGAGFIGLRDDIRETTGETVTLANVMRATFAEIAGGVSSTLAPAIAWLKEDFSKLTTAIIEDVRNVGDFLINGFEASYNVVTQMWGQLPEVFGYLMYEAARRVLGGLSELVQMGINDLNTLIELANNIPGVNINAIGDFQGFQLDNPFSDVGAELNGIISDAFSDSPMGAFFERVGERAAALATSIEDVGSAAQSAGAPMDLLGNSVQAANDNFEAGRGIFSSFFSDLSGQIQQGASVWDAFKTAGLNALNSLLDKAMEMATNNLFMSLFGNGTTSSGGLGSLFSGLFGGGSTANLFGPGTSMPLYEQGTNYVPNTGPAILHKGEAVVPAKYNNGGGASGGVSVIRVELSGDVQAQMVDTAANVSVQVVRASSPGIVNQSVASTGGALKSGQMDGPMANRFGLGKTARPR